MDEHSQEEDTELPVCVAQIGNMVEGLTLDQIHEQAVNFTFDRNEMNTIFSLYKDVN